MNVVNRSELVKILEKNKGNHEQFFSMLASRSQKARDSFNRMYRKKPIEDWSDEEKQTTLGYILGFNVICDSM